MGKRKTRNIIVTGIVGALVTAAVLVPGSGRSKAKDSFFSDRFEYGELPSSQSVSVKRTACTGKEWTGETLEDGTQTLDVTSVNALSDSVNAIPYSDKETAFYGAKDYDREGSDYYQLLSGEDRAWSLTVLDSPQEAEKLAGFETSDYEMQEEDGWKQVELPASWTSYGFDYSIYTNTDMPFSAAFPKAPTTYNPTGLYRTEFVVKDTMLQENGKVYLTFGGVESAYYVYVNGTQVGYSEDSYNPHTFDITDLLNPQGEENLLAVKVMKYCDGTWLEDQDMIYDGGIFRDVYLTSTPNVHISDYEVEADLSDDYQSATVEVDLSVTNDSVTDAAKMGAEVTLYASDGSIFAEGDFALEEILSGETNKTTLRMEVANPELWDADHPNLYTMVVSLYDKEAQCHYESVSQNLGFRKLTFTSTQVSDDGKYSNVTDSYEQVKLNGKKLLIKGVNRHDTDPETGKYVSHEVYETDIQLMKQNNINAIRTSHYADDDYLYYLCDKYGLYVMCETNNESHALQNKEESLKKLETAAMSRQVTSYERFKNTTSNLFWSIGNESTQGKAQGDFANGMFAKMVAYFKDRDDTRMVHYEGLCSGVDAAGGVDMISHMYYPPSSVEAGTKLESQMPYLLCEYDHAMGNAVGSLSDYWNLIRSADNLMGGFIWDWVDQSRKIALKDGDWDYYAQENAHASGLNDLAGYYLGYGGDWNEEDGTKDANFCMNGLVSADRDPQPELKEVKYQYQDIWFTSSEDVLQGHKITISNESISKKLSEYQVVWELQEDGETVDSGVLEQEVLAGETKEVTVPYNLPEKLKAGAEYYLNLSVQTTQESIVGEAGYEIAYGQFKVDAETVKATREVASGVTITPDDGNYLVQGEDFEFTVNGNTGVMENYYYQGKLLIKEGPTVNFDRATTDNDKGVLYTLDVSKNLTMNGTPEISQDSMGRNVITVEWNIHREAQQGEKAPYTGDGTVQIQYVIEGNGAVGINLNYDLTGIDVRGKNDKFMKVGTIMTLAEDSEAISWYGNGDGESYSDRCSYTRVGTYTSTVSDMYYPFAKPQDCGNLTGVRWISVANQDTGYGVLISAADEVNASALHFTPSDLAAADHTGDLTPSKETYLTIDTAVAGIGNSSCGFEALEQYRVTDKVYAYSYTILPVTKTTDKMSTALGYRSDVEVTGGADAQVTTPSVDTTAAPVTETAAPNASVTETAVPGGTETIGTVAVTSPKKVSGVKVKASGKKKLTVQWKNGSKVSYKVAYSTDKKQLAKLKNGSTKAVSGVFVADAKKNRVILKKLKTGKKYYVKVCAYTKENGVITAGNWSAVKVKKVK